MSDQDDIVLLPGMGTDGRLHARVAGYLPSVRSPAWIPALAHESLAIYAQRYAQYLQIAPGCVIGGSSLGGMVALEIAKLIPVRAVILIGSCRNIQAVAPWIRRLSPLRNQLPDRAFLSPAATEMVMRTVIGIHDAALIRLHQDMLQDVGIGFLRWGLRAVLQWPGVAVSNCPVYHIHGGRDRLIPVTRVKPQKIITPAGHVPALTHSRDVAEFIAQSLGISLLA